MVKWF